MQFFERDDYLIRQPLSILLDHGEDAKLSVNMWGDLFVY